MFLIFNFILCRCDRFYNLSHFIHCVLFARNVFVIFKLITPFVECFYNVAKEFTDIEADDKIIDNCCMQLVMRPEQFDVLVLENLYGDIVSDLCAGLIGGLGLAPGANIGELGAVFEAVHGSAPDIAGQGIANPTALMLSAVQMLNYIGERGCAKRMHDAILAVFADGKSITRDLGGTAKTNEFARAIEEKIKAGASATA